MADQDDADKIRLKRLAKLQNSNDSSSQKTPTKPSPAPSPKPTPQPPPIPKPATPAVSRQPSASNPPPKPVVSAPSVPFEQWQTSTIASVLNITSDPASQSSRIYISDLERGQQLEESMIDQILVSAMMTEPKNNTTKIEYLVSCWKSVQPKISEVNRDKTDPTLRKRLAVLDTLKNSILSYIAITLAEPSVWPQPENKPIGAAELVPILANQPLPSTSQLKIESSSLVALLGQMAVRISTQAGVDLAQNSCAELSDALAPVLSGLVSVLDANASIQARVMRAMGLPSTSKPKDLLGSEARDIARILNHLTESKHVASAITDIPSFNPDTSAPSFEFETLFGPLVRLSCTSDAFPHIAASYFANASQQSDEALGSAVESLRSALTMHQNQLFRMFNDLIRANPRSRENVLDFWAKAIKLNVKKAGTHVDRSTVSSDGFMFNILSVLLSFAQPFTTPGGSKVDKVDTMYYRNSTRVPIEEETKIHATLDEARKYYGFGADDMQLDRPKPNFISDVFFLTTAFIHYSISPAMSYFERLFDAMHRTKRDIKEMEQDTSVLGTPQEAEHQAELTELKRQYEHYCASVQASRVQLLDRTFLTSLAQFLNFTMAWLIRMVDPKGSHPTVPIQLPLPDQTPEKFGMLPEYLIEDVTEFWHFVSRHDPEILRSTQLDDLLTFIIIFLHTPYVHNPYLKGKFVEILYNSTRNFGPRYPQGFLTDALNSMPLALQSLVPALMQIYIDIETTGTHNQFYEKFQTRYFVAQLFKLIWTNPVHREALRKSSSEENFITFTNRLMTDTTFLLDESVSRLQKIHQIQTEMASPAWAGKTDEEKKDGEKMLKESENVAGASLKDVTENLRLFKIFTSEARAPFLKDEIVDRLAAMLDINVESLAGPKCSNLKVAEPQKYGFRPRELLSDILQIIINLSGEDRFAQAVARDARSYSKGLFEKAMGIAIRAGLIGDADLTPIRKLIAKVDAIQEEEAAEEEMGEAPDEFLDPLMSEIMTEPVYLPTSKTIVDLKTIKQHLLSSPLDPFNRAPLKIEDVVPDMELKQQIQEWKANRKQERLEAKKKAAEAAAAQEEANYNIEQMDMSV